MVWYFERVLKGPYLGTFFPKPRKQNMVQEKLEEVVWPQSKNLVHEMVRNKDIDTWPAALIVFFGLMEEFWGA